MKIFGPGKTPPSEIFWKFIRFGEYRRPLPFVSWQQESNYLVFRMGDLNFLRSLFEEIVLFIFELILWELYKDWFGTHGFTLLVLLEGARVTFSVPSCLCQISCQLPICLSLLLSWCLWFHEYPCLFRFSLVEIFSLPRFFSCQDFSLAKIFSYQNCPLDNIFLFLVSKFVSRQDFHFFSCQDHFELASQSSRALCIVHTKSLRRKLFTLMILFLVLW